MFTIDAVETTQVHADYDFSPPTPAGEQAKLIAQGVVLQPGIAVVMPRETKLLHLTSVGERHVYTLSVRGWTVGQFIAIATAYAREDFAEAARLTNELRTASEYDD